MIPDNAQREDQYIIFKPTSEEYKLNDLKQENDELKNRLNKIEKILYDLTK